MQGDAEALPFEDAAFDSYTVAFGIRNMTNRAAALAEARRVLRRGGRLLCLEFSTVPDPLLRQLYDAYSFSVIPRLGGLVASDAGSYQYLVESIRQFPDQVDGACRAQGWRVRACAAGRCTHCAGAAAAPRTRAQEAWAQQIRDAGFKAVTYENLTGGVVAIHSGFKL